MNDRGRLRIIGGSHRSRIVQFAELRDRAGFRPTPDRVRETLFNWLGQDLRGRRCLDAFAGSGALAFEAASRGASSVLALDEARDVIAALRRNQRTLGFETLCIEQADAFVWLAAAGGLAERFDVIFLDPPFAADPWRRLAPLVLAVAAPGAAIYAESARELGDDDLPGFSRRRHGRAGAVHYHLFVPLAASDAATTSEDA